MERVPNGFEFYYFQVYVGSGMIRAQEWPPAPSATNHRTTRCDSTIPNNRTFGPTFLRGALQDVELSTYRCRVIEPPGVGWTR